MRLEWALFIALVLVGAASVAVAADGAVTLPLDPPSAQPRQGPSSMRVGPGGELYVADPARRTIQRFSPAGALESTHTLPGSVEKETRATVMDFVVGPGGELYVLQVTPRGVGLLGTALGSLDGCGSSKEASAGSILVVRPDGSTSCLARIPTKQQAPRLLDRIERDAEGRLFVHDSFDNGILRFDVTGQMVECGVFEGCPELVLDRKGGVYGAQATDSTGAPSVTVWRMDLATREKRPVVELKQDSPVSSVSMVGVDDKGRIYVEVTRGPNENPTERAVLVVGAGGQVAARLAVPARPWEFPMHRSRAIVPSGGVTTARVANEGLVVEPHPLPAAR